MTPHILIALYCILIAFIAFVIWKIAKLNLYRQRVNRLKHGDKIEVEGIEGYYMYRLGKNNHRVNLTGSFHEVDVDEIKIK